MSEKEGNPIDLLDLVREDAEVEIGDKSYTLRAFDLVDEAWLRRTFGDSIQSIFEELRMLEICSIVFHQLGDKSDFAARKEKYYNDEGVEGERLVTGPELVLKAMKDRRQMMNVFVSLMQTIGVSRPIVDEIKKDLKPKKKRTQTKKKRPQKRATGEKSLTS